MKNVHNIEIEIKEKEWTEVLDAAFEKKNKEIKVDGFRKGKCPKNIYIKKFGVESLYMDAVDGASTKAYLKAINDNKLIPVCEPKMDIKEILAKCDHTLLKQTATWPDIQALCDDAKKFHTASVCIPPCYVKAAKMYLKNSDVKVCTVIGFPNGNSTTAMKVLETVDAVNNGADEIDMVINIGALIEGRYLYVEDEIREVKAACMGRVLKVIIETCLLSDGQKIIMCKLVSKAGADYIKTSTGFSAGGATFEDVKLFKQHVDPSVKIKAAGGISSLEDAQKFIELGADRLGTSRIVKIAKELYRD